MTNLQQKTIYEMMRQGLHNQLNIAEHCWQEHREYQIAGNIFIPRLLNELIEKSNREVTHLLH